MVENGTPQQDLKVLLRHLVEDANIVPSGCIPIKPQSEGKTLCSVFPKETVLLS